MEDINIIQTIINSGSELGIRYSKGLDGYVVSGTHDVCSSFESALIVRLEILLQKE